MAENAYRIDRNVIATKIFNFNDHELYCMPSDISLIQITRVAVECSAVIVDFFNAF